MNEPAQFDLATFLQLVRRRVWLIIAVAIAAAGLAFGFSKLQHKRYEATAELLFHPTQAAPPVDPSEPTQDNQQAPERVAATNLALASRDTVAQKVKERLHSPLSIEDLRKKVDLKPKGQADIVEVTGSAPTPQGAVGITNVFAQEIVALRRKAAQQRVQGVIDAINQQLASVPAGSASSSQLRRRAAQLAVQKRLKNGDVEIAESPIPPTAPAAPKPLRNTVIGALLGLILGVLLAVLLGRLDRRVRDEEEVAEIVDAPVLARVPLDGDSEVEQQLFLEAFQFLRANVQLRDPDRKHQVIAVTSALPEHGKSTVAAEFASALALSGADVVLVDADLRRPTLHEHFKVDGSDGVTSVVVSSKRATDLLRRTTLPGVRLLPAGPVIPIPASIMAGGRHMVAMLRELRAVSDYVVVDTSPVTVGADASAVAAAVDGVLIVVDSERIQRDVLRISCDQLRASGAEIMGVVLNRAKIVLKDSAYRGYYEAGRAAGQQKALEGGKKRRRRRRRADPNGAGPEVEAAEPVADAQVPDTPVVDDAPASEPEAPADEPQAERAEG